jgi:hypothetical protein
MRIVRKALLAAVACLALAAPAAGAGTTPHAQPFAPVRPAGLAGLRCASLTAGPLLEASPQTTDEAVSVLA